MINGLTFIVAFCSLVYELVLAQTLAAIWGNTVLRYNVTVGIYLSALGFAAILYYRKERNADFSQLFKVEILLSLIGFLGPGLIFLMDLGVRNGANLLGVDDRSGLVQLITFVSFHIIIVAIGFLSGLELPLLLEIDKRQSGKDRFVVLGVDYMGSMLGALCFPLILLPKLGILKVAAFTGLLNSIVALFVVSRMKTHRAGAGLLTLTTIALLLIFLLFPQIAAYIEQTIYA